MARGIDIGAYIERLTERAAGGRRLDRAEPTDGRGRGSGGSSGGLKDALRDALGGGRRAGKRAVERSTAAVREQVRQRRTTGLAGGRTTGLPPEGVVHVEYSPRRDGDPDPGEVVWTWVPFEEDPSQGKDRPVVIIGRRGRNLVGVPLTTKADDREAQVDLGSGDWDPKRRTSYARVWRMLDVDPERTRREGATLDRARFDRLVAAVDHYYDIVRPGGSSTSADRWDY